MRGSTSALEELLFILRKTQASGLIVEDTQILDKFLPHLSIPVKSNGASSLNGASANGASFNGSAASQVMTRANFRLLVEPGRPN